MFRCFICDFSPDVGSEYYDSLAFECEHNRLIEVEDGFVCLACYDAYEDSLGEFDLDESI